jgi:D-alanyl-D-alanine carboxypeptidase
MNRQLAITIAVTLISVAASSCGVQNPKSSGPSTSRSSDSPPSASTYASTDQPQQPRRTGDVSSTVTTSQSAIQSVLDEWTHDGPGGVTVALTRAGQPTATYTSGVADADGRPIVADDQIRIGSITKVFVAVMTLQLVDERTVDLDRFVTSYLPEMTVADGVTVRQLLNHTSGIPDFNSDALSLEIIGDMSRAWTAQEVVARVAGQPRDFAPGTDAKYSSTNYALAGLLVERVTGMSLAANLQSRIAKPLGLTNTYLAPDTGREPIAGFTPYLPGGTTTAAPYTAIATVAGAAGGMVSNTHDLVTFITALTDGRLISATMLDAMTADTSNSQFGFGIEYIHTPAGVAYGKRGAITGYDCEIGIMVNTGDTFVILGNDDSRDMEDLVAQVTSSWT